MAPLSMRRDASATGLPLSLDRRAAAGLCGLSPSGFDVWVTKGIVPRPISGTRRWSRYALECAINGNDNVPLNDDASPFRSWQAKNANSIKGH